MEQLKLTKVKFRLSLAETKTLAMIVGNHYKPENKLLLLAIAEWALNFNWKLLNKVLTPRKEIHLTLKLVDAYMLYQILDRFYTKNIWTSTMIDRILGEIDRQTA
jgi:hypothetical protein